MRLIKFSTPLILYDKDEKKKRWGFLKWGIGLLFVFLLLVPIWLGFYAISPGPLEKEEGAVVFIPPETGFYGIQDILASEGIIKKDVRFSVLARLMQVTHKLKAGEYLFEEAQTPIQVLSVLERGIVLHRPVTIIEGANIYQIADVLATGGWVERERFLKLVKDSAFIREFNLAVGSLEGYLFPDTYYFSRGQSARIIIQKMVNRLKEVLKELTVAGKLPLSQHELLTLASIVEKETAVPEERPLIASVFLNRLKRGMRLQTDPTVIYGLTNFDGNLTRKDLKTPSPYNTYVIKGLPPGPIGSPGRAAIEAVINPAKGSYLYFVSKNDGSHHFSKKLSDHNRAVVRYQKRRNRR